MSRELAKGVQMSILDYDQDEALRVTRITLMFEGETFTFEVRNSNKLFTLMLASHTICSDKPHELVMCKHAGADNTHYEPCTGVSRDIKDAARKSIAVHKAKFHFLKTVK